MSDRPMVAFPVPRDDEPEVFVETYQIENAGHIAQLWSDEVRCSHAECSCGWVFDDAGATFVLDKWRSHVEAVRV